VYARDAATGRLKWQNNATGHMDPVGRTGVSVQGHLMAFDGRLWLAGGNVVSPAVFDLRDGRCLNDPKQHVRRTVNNNVPSVESPRGSELHRVGKFVFVSGKPLYASPKYPVHDNSVTHKIPYTQVGDRELAWVNSEKLCGFAADPSSLPGAIARSWGQSNIAGVKPLWTVNTPGGRALAVGKNAAVVATDKAVEAFDLGDGRRLWRHPLASPPVHWGLALTRNGGVLVSLENGEVVCLR
jgi:outer membrane protein assembly factor BamB